MGTQPPPHPPASKRRCGKDEWVGVASFSNSPEKNQFDLYNLISPQYDPRDQNVKIYKILYCTNNNKQLVLKACVAVPNWNVYVYANYIVMDTTINHTCI